MQNTIQETQNTRYLTKMHKENTKYKIPKIQNKKYKLKTFNINIYNIPLEHRIQWLPIQINTSLYFAYHKLSNVKVIYYPLLHLFKTLLFSNTKFTFHFKNHSNL